MVVETNMMPVAFASHGSPMVAVEEGPLQSALGQFGRKLRPKAVLVISAHWNSEADVRIASAARHSLMYDFGGFPKELYELTYPAPGDPQLATRVKAMLEAGGVRGSLDDTRALDHGVWVPLRLMYPAADIPVVEISVPAMLGPQQLFRSGALLAPLRNEEVLLLGSGGLIHNLRLLDWHDRNAPVRSWAREFDEWFTARLAAGDIAGLLDYRRQAPNAALAAPTTDHFDPLFPILGAATDNAPIETICDAFEYGTLSLRSFVLG